MFQLTSEPIDHNHLRQQIQNQSAGALVVFEGWVRDHNQGEAVLSLEYEAYPELCQSEAQKIINEAKEKFNLTGLNIVHRTGHLSLQDIAVWIGATAHHRDDAFKASRFCIDEIKHRLPIWKREHYKNVEPRWVFCRDHAHHVHFEARDFYQKQHELVNQSKLSASKVVVIGAGGLGCPVLQSLAMAGVGKMTIIDGDKIELTNLHRQPLYSPNLIGEFKAVIAQNKMQELNPLIQVKAYTEFINADNIAEYLVDCDLVIDCTDNLQTKDLINRFCHNHKLPFITASIFKTDGVLRTVIPLSATGCSACFKPMDQSVGNCNDYGVIGAHVSMLGTMQAAQAIDYLSRGQCESIEITMLINFSNFEIMKIKNQKQSDCYVCSQDLVELENVEVSHAEIAKFKHTLIDLRENPNFDHAQLKNTEQKFIFQCAAGNLSYAVVKGLRALGHTNCFSLLGGAKRACSHL